MKVFELDKYPDKHNLLTGKKALKDDKVKCIISHVIRNDSSETHTNIRCRLCQLQKKCMDESDKDDDEEYNDDDDDEHKEHKEG